MKISRLSLLTSIASLLMLILASPVAASSQQIVLSCTLDLSPNSCSNTIAPGTGSCPTTSNGQAVLSCVSDLSGFWLSCDTSSNGNGCSGSVYIGGTGEPIKFYQGFGVKGSMSSGVITLTGTVDGTAFTCMLTPPSALAPGSHVNVPTNCPATSPIIINTDVLGSSGSIIARVGGYVGTFSNVLVGGNSGS